MIEPDLWLCALDNKDGGTWEEAHTACNENENYFLATVTSMTARGAPSDSNISPAMKWAKSEGFTFAITGQPTRKMSWDGTKKVDGLGAIWTFEVKIPSKYKNWDALLDGNGNDKRSWPHAVPPSYSSALISLCQNAQSIKNSCVYDFRWRVGTFSNCTKHEGNANITK